MSRESIKITQEEAAAIYDGDNDDYEMVDSGRWESGSGDYQSASCIVKDKSGNHFRLWMSKDMLSFTFDNYLEPVKEVEVTVKRWVTD